LFVHGDSDEFGSVGNLKPLVDEVAKITDAKLVVFPNCGHFFDDHLNELREAIREWVNGKLTEDGK
jgi:alpha/beta superfamily hydrolase